MSIEDIDLSFRKSLELDFHEIDEKLNSEIPLELKCHMGNILSLIKEAIEKLKISLILPKILENPKVLHQYLRNTKYCNCLKLVQEYRNKEQSKSSQEPYQMDYHVIQIIDYFQRNYKILDVLPNWLDDIDKTEKYLLAAFNDVYEIAKRIFQRSATEVLAKEKQLHEVYLANEEVKRNTNETMHRLEMKKLNRLWKLASKNVVMKKLEDELSILQYDNNMFVKRKILSSYRQIQEIDNVFAGKQQALEEDMKKARLNYETKLTMNLANEKSIRHERNKLELQLEALIKKYDQTMYDKYIEEILLQKEYEKEKQELDDYLIVYEREDAIYEELVGKKERQCKNLQEAKILLFTYNFAVKKIQRWWKEMSRKMGRAAVNVMAKGKATKQKQTGNKKTQNKSGSKGNKKK